MIDTKKKTSETVEKAAKVKAEVRSYGINPGDKAPTFALAKNGEGELSSKDLKDRAYVLYFYPKDNTPGCTIEGHDFEKLSKKFAELDCDVLGVSKDSVKSHDKFVEKCGFKFPLLSDEEGELCKAYDVIQMKNMYGKKFEGIERSTFFVDAKGIVRGVWRKVKVPGHADAVLSFVKEARAK